LVQGLIGVSAGSILNGANLVFRGNYAKLMASAIYSTNSQIILTNSTFIENKCDGKGTLSL